MDKNRSNSVIHTLRQDQKGQRRWIGRLLTVLMLSTLTGCAHEALMLPESQQQPIDRKYVEYPTGFILKPIIKNLTAPSAIAFAEDGTLFVAESGLGDTDPHIFAYSPDDGTRTTIYPSSKRIPLFKTGFRIYGPIGGIVADQGKLYVTHRDEAGRGVITAFGRDGSHTTIVADLPAQGDFSVTDLAIAPNGQLFFGVGAATNSGVVGLDNWAWVDKYPNFSDTAATNLKLLGYRFDTRNPLAGWFGGDDIAVTAPYQPFGTSTKTLIPQSPTDRPTAAIYSVNPAGGGLKVEASGIRYPRGLAFNEFGNLYMTNNGMELRGTRPVKDDPDTLLRVISGTWYGWPDFSADLFPITDSRFQPGAQMIIQTGYPDLGFLIDHESSGLLRPDRNLLVRSVFPPLSGAAKLVFAPSTGPLNEFHGNAIIAMAGDRAPFATSGKPLIGPIGHKVIRVDLDTHQAKDFIYNTRGMPRSMLPDHPEYALERPVDVTISPDGTLYIVDMGQVTWNSDKPRILKNTGVIYRLVPLPPQTQPTGWTPASE